MGLRSATMLGLAGLAGLAALGACTGDTLYDADVVPPPAIEIVNPTAGEEFVVGDTIEVQVLAEDTLLVREIELELTFTAETDTVAETVPLTIGSPRELVDTTTKIVRDRPGELELRAAATNEQNAVGRSQSVTVLVREPEDPVF